MKNFPRYLDKDGSEIPGVLSWAEKFEDDDYRRVAETTLPDGKWVSTIWLGLNHQYGDGPPLIFESMIFSNEEKMDVLDSRRYSTEAEAKAGHIEMVAEWEQKSQS